MSAAGFVPRVWQTHTEWSPGGGELLLHDPSGMSADKQKYDAVDISKPQYADAWAVHRWHHLWLGGSDKHKHKHDHDTPPPPPLEVWDGTHSTVTGQADRPHEGGDGRPEPGVRLWAAGGPRYHKHGMCGLEWVGGEGCGEKISLGHTQAPPPRPVPSTSHTWAC